MDIFPVAINYCSDFFIILKREVHEWKHILKNIFRNVVQNSSEAIGLRAFFIFYTYYLLHSMEIRQRLLTPCIVLTNSCVKNEFPSYKCRFLKPVQVWTCNYNCLTRVQFLTWNCSYDPDEYEYTPEPENIKPSNEIVVF